MVKKLTPEDENVNTVISLFLIILTASLIEIYLLLTAIDQALSIYAN